MDKDSECPELRKCANMAGSVSRTAFGLAEQLKSTKMFVAAYLGSFWISEPLSSLLACAYSTEKDAKRCNVKDIILQPDINYTTLVIL